MPPTDPQAERDRHICGDPASACDAECMARAYESQAKRDRLRGNSVLVPGPELAKLRQERDDLAGQVTRLTAHVANLQDERDRLVDESNQDFNDTERQLGELKAQVATLTSERDEAEQMLGYANRDLDYARAHRSFVADRLNVPMPQCEGRVWEAINKALDEVATLTARVQRAEMALRELEWISSSDPYAAEFGSWCPCCGELRRLGHSKSCGLAAALGDATP